MTIREPLAQEGTDSYKATNADADPAPTVMFPPAMAGILLEPGDELLHRLLATERVVTP
jgi:hypothetical protein